MKANTIGRRFLRTLLIVVTVHGIEIILAAAIWLGLQAQTRVSLSARLGEGPELGGFERYVVSHFTAGMSRKQVIEQADVIGPYRVKPFFSGGNYCETIYFNVGPLQTTLGVPWWICYDEQDRVISVMASGSL